MISTTRRLWIGWLSAALLLVIGALDVITGFELSFSIFYLLPIGLVAWYVGRWQGQVFSVMSALVWLYADLDAEHIYSHWAYPLWNAGTRLVVFGLVVELLDRMHQSLRRERKLALSDPLTGAANTRQLRQRLELELARHRRTGQPLALVYLDLDNFKHVNDRWGHAEGDEVLRVVVQSLQRRLRATDLVARMGGDEFALLLPETHADEAERLVETLRARLVGAMRERTWPVTCSVGVVCCARVHGVGVADLLRRADALMYQVKHQTKDDVRVLRLGELEGLEEAQQHDQQGHEDDQRADHDDALRPHGASIPLRRAVKGGLDLS